MSTQKHPLAGYPEDEKVDYLSLVASIAAADENVTDDEVTILREFCTTIGIHEIGIGMIIAAAGDPSVIDIQAIIPRLSQTDLKFTLLTDMFFMAYADGIVSPEEEKEINKIAAKLQISRDQLAAIDRYVDAVVSAQHSSPSKTDWKKSGSEIAGSLASAGVPLGAIVISGSLVGSGAAGITSGLTALGMGLGMTTGIGVALSLGVGSYLGVRWLFKRIFGETDDE